jgi:hypothetical protein
VITPILLRARSLDEPGAGIPHAGIWEGTVGQPAVLPEPMHNTSMLGGCLCGAVRYKIVQQPRTLYACHCKDCQTVSGASFVLAMQVPSSGMEIVRGEPRLYARARSDGRKKNVFRCPSCLTALWSSHIEPHEYVTVYAGTLDDTSDLRPVAHLWTRDAQSWIALPKDGLLFDEGPPNMQMLVQAWRDQE